MRAAEGGSPYGKSSLRSGTSSVIRLAGDRRMPPSPCAGKALRGPPRAAAPTAEKGRMRNDVGDEDCGGRNIYDAHIPRPGVSTGAPPLARGALRKNQPSALTKRAEGWSDLCAPPPGGAHVGLLSSGTAGKEQILAAGRQRRRRLLFFSGGIGRWNGSICCWQACWRSPGRWP